MGLFNLFKKKNAERKIKTEIAASIFDTNQEIVSSAKKRQDETYTANNVEEAISILHKKIIEELAKNPKAVLRSGYLLDFICPIKPTEKHNIPSFMDGAAFYLNLNTRKLSVTFSSYPNQFGACYESKFDITYADFCSYKYQFKEGYLRYMQTEHDWNELFDKELLEQISNEQEIAKKHKEEQVNTMKVSIPERFFTTKPKMDFSEITIKIYRMYGHEAVTVLKENGLYRITYETASKLSTDANKYSRTLSVSEAVWLEEQLATCINNPDEAVWKSVVGGERMSVKIYKKKALTKIEGMPPLVKYHDLLNALEHLAEYGSKIAK